MSRAYSRLHDLLVERGLTCAELQRRLQVQERAFDIKALYRLADPFQPLERLDLALGGAICRVFGISLAELVVFAEPPGTLDAFPAAKQERLDALLDRHEEGDLAPEEMRELGALVAEAERLALANARRLAERRRQLQVPNAVRRSRVS